MPLVSKHKKSLEQLKETQPEFYKFLQKEDENLLKFDANEDDSSDDDSSDDEGSSKASSEDDDDISLSSSDDEEEFHRLPQKLEVDSDNSDDASDSDADSKQVDVKKKKISKTLKASIVHDWSQQLMTKPNLSCIHNAVEAFRAAVLQTADAKEANICKYEVKSGTVFNAVVRLCIRDLFPALDKFLEIKHKPGKTVQPSSCKNWTKVKQNVKIYLSDSIELLSHISEPNILHSVLRHILEILPYYMSFPKILRMLLKRAITIWSSSDEKSRVIALLIINRAISHKNTTCLDYCLKLMYTAYIKNCKFTSVTLLPSINFMQRSLAELLAINQHTSYQFAFIYIRQLAIHLRNAITTKKKDTCQAVYNWQYIHSLALWVTFISVTHPSEVLSPLIYPLTQVIIGTIKLLPTAKYYPLRFRCLRMLITLCKDTGTFIPVLPFITEVLDLTDFNKRATRGGANSKPFNFACMLKLSKVQMEEKHFRDGVIDEIFELTLEYLNVMSHTISFPELITPTMLQFKQFLKNCRVPIFTKQIKILLDKSKETSDVILQRRKNAAQSVQEIDAINAWTTKSKNEGTGLNTYYATWRKIKDRELQQMVTNKHQISMENMPKINKIKKKQREVKKSSGGLFDSDDEDAMSDDLDDEIRFLPREERNAKRKISEKSSSSKKRKTEESESDDDDDDDYDDDDVDVDDDDINSDDEEDNEGASDDDDDEEDSDVEDTGDVVEDFKFSDEEDDDDSEND